MATILFRTLTVYAVISVVFRLMGKRQVGDLELSDLVATLLLSELASLPIADHNIPLLNALIPIAIILCLEILLTFGKNKLRFLKRVLESEPSVLIRRGQLDQGELMRMRISIEELIGECRQQGYGDLSDIYYAILEQDGQLSLIPRVEKAPLTAEDAGVLPRERGLAYPIVTDGVVHEGVLKRLGRDEAWLEKECKRRGTEIADVFLLTLNDADEVYMIRKEKA